MEQQLSETTDFRVKELAIEIAGATFTDKPRRFDITNIFSELNLFDNLFTPCMSGNIMIDDAIGMLEILNSTNSDKFIRIHIDKGDMKNQGAIALSYQKVFQIYKTSNLKNKNMNSKVYVLHFITPEFLLSKKLKISRAFDGNYSDFVKTILEKDLKVRNAVGNTAANGKSGIGSIYKSKSPQKIIVPNLDPFEAIEWMAYRAVSDNFLPDYVFYESPQVGYNFMPIGELLSYDYRFRFNFSPKNISGGEFEFAGVRDFKLKTSSNLIKNIDSGMYAGVIKGFDPMIRKRKDQKITFFDVFDKMKHANKNPILPIKKDDFLKLYESRVVSHPTFNLDNRNTNKLDNTQDYIFKRKSIFYNLMQRRIEFAVPGNFSVCSGHTAQLDFPRYSDNRTGNLLDEDYSGKYIITGVRHIIRYNIHETMLEVATDSTNRKE